MLKLTCMSLHCSFSWSSLLHIFGLFSSLDQILWANVNLTMWSTFFEFTTFSKWSFVQFTCRELTSLDSHSSMFLSVKSFRFSTSMRDRKLKSELGFSWCFECLSSLKQFSLFCGKNIIKLRFFTFFITSAQCLWLGSSLFHVQVRKWFTTVNKNL